MKKQLRNIFITFTLMTIIETSYMAMIQEDRKNPPRFQSSIVSTIQSYSKSV
ncbi:hypothetical protein LS684_20020 [Cytobacillus spongiae]|uniref:hypothetical protein n=1 Tax=Cytobacillus spongiae TaxID=2901381 RepID=UPI001F3FB1D0|nr:hypothetical protein [Cytobacillus spongiae]UII55878.1 hypothetical protein LS684_20020 [Cytobacillus spongiae]